MKGVLIFYIIQKHDLSYQNFKKKKNAVYAYTVP